MQADSEFFGEQREILLGFIEEVREMLDEVEPLLIDMENTAQTDGTLDLETLNTVFRLFHSLKGGAGFLDLITVSKVTYVAETLLDLFRKGIGTLESWHIDLITRACDFLRMLLDQIETNLTDKGFESEAKELIDLLQNAVDSLENNGGDVETVEETAEPSPEEGKLSDSPGEMDSEDSPDEEQPPQESEPSKIPEEMLQLIVTPEIVATFTNEAEELLESAEQSLLSLEKDPADQEHIATAFRSFHSFKGNAAFLGYGDLENLGHKSETALDKIREGEILAGDKVLTLLLEIIDFLRNALTTLREGGEPRIPAAPGLISLLEDAVKETQKGPRAAETAKTKPSSEPPAGKTKAKKKARPEAIKETSETVKADSKAPGKVVETAPDTPEVKDIPSEKIRQSDPTGSVQCRAMQRNTVRVDAEKLDSLLDLVGELVIVELMVVQNPDLKELDVSLDRFDKAVRQLDKITRDLQDVSTSIRMIPIAGTFRRMLRLVRDVSHRAGKKVELIITGEETEVDKTVIEHIIDPLVHIIRNSIDHGLESPEERKEIGKPETGIVELNALYVGGEVWIKIRDDGRGLNRQKILDRAIERGLVKGDESDLKDEEVWPLIFHPGFSTAEKVTDVSGRGVGMDVVKRNIEHVRGKVDIQSIEGTGTIVILRIPLTLAIIDGMIVRIGKAHYTIPLVEINESLQPIANNVTRTMDGQEIVRIRDQMIPVVRLGDHFGIKAEAQELEDGILVVVSNEGNSVCLFVDEMVGQQQIVIKGLSSYIGTIEGVSGCTILGDRTISLIIDITGLIDSVQSE